MTSARRLARIAAPAAIGLGLALFPRFAAAAPLDLYYERTVMVAADARCGLFAPEIGAALAAARAQARGAALRAGVDQAMVEQTGARAIAAARRADCASQDVATAAGRVRQAFEGYARLIRMDYPGEVAGWTADRSSSKTAVRWRLQQATRSGDTRIAFGLAGRFGANRVMAVAAFPKGETPYAARLVIRDRALAPKPYLDLRTRTLAKRLPPPTARTAFAAEARSRAGLDLLPKGWPPSWAFRFPSSSAEALAALDPREAAAVEFLFPGDRIRTVYLEVGDFAAGRAFLQVER